MMWTVIKYSAVAAWSFMWLVSIQHVAAKKS